MKYTTGKELTVALREHLNDYNVTTKENVMADKMELGELKNTIVKRRSHRGQISNCGDWCEVESLSPRRKRK